MSNSSDSELDEIAAAAAALVVITQLPKPRKKRRYHVREYYTNRKVCGRYYVDMPNLKKDDALFKQVFRMSILEFESLYASVKHRLEPKPHSRPDCLTGEEKLMATIEFLAIGDRIRTFQTNYYCSKATIHEALHNVCDAIIEIMKPKVMPVFSKEMWVDASNKYHAAWNLPNCLGAIDGKHVRLTKPPSSGTLFHAYKGFPTVVLMAVADAEYKFVFTDIGQYGSEGDSTVFQNSEFGQALYTEELDLPSDLPIRGIPTPFFFIGDDAFPHTNRIQKNYSCKKEEALEDHQLVFNYRMNRARRCVENTFGILVARQNY